MFQLTTGRQSHHAHERRGAERGPPSAVSTQSWQETGKNSTSVHMRTETDSPGKTGEESQVLPAGSGLENVSNLDIK